MSTFDYFQFLLGCYCYFMVKGTVRTASLSIPFRMLLLVTMASMISSCTTFNSFQDATGEKRFCNCPCCLNFQFLLGCYSRAWREAGLPDTRLSIPFRMLRLDSALLKRRLNRSFNSFQDATNASRVASTFTNSIFQFLLGCYLVVVVLYLSLCSILSIPFRMLPNVAGTAGLAWANIFQFLLGCYPLKNSPNSWNISRLSIPFRMLPSTSTPAKPCSSASFNSFQDAT